VEIIHINGGLLGFLAAIGNVDFYPNGSEKQLGCVMDPGDVCSHTHRFFAESINSHEKSYNSFL